MSVEETRNRISQPHHDSPACLPILLPVDINVRSISKRIFDRLFELCTIQSSYKAKTDGCLLPECILRPRPQARIPDIRRDGTADLTRRKLSRSKRQKNKRTNKNQAGTHRDAGNVFLALVARHLCLLRCPKSIERYRLVDRKEDGCEDEEEEKEAGRDEEDGV